MSLITPYAGKEKVNIYKPGIPRHFRIHYTMYEDLLLDPVLAVWVLWRLRLDPFQAAGLRIDWFTPVTEDSSGFGSTKSLRGYLITNLSAVLIPECVVGVIFQTFQSMKNNYWSLYQKFPGTPLFKAQLGLYEDGQERKGSARKEPSTYKRHFKNGSRIEAPAPDNTKDAEKLGSWQVNRMLIDEANKVREMGEGVMKQFFGRVRLSSYNKHHPVWCNKVWKKSTAEEAGHPAYQDHVELEKEVQGGSVDVFTYAFHYKYFSNLPSHTGKSFREEFRDDKMIRVHTKHLTESGVRTEIFGLWGRRTGKWYPPESLDQCQQLGAKRGLVPVVSRRGDDMANDNTFYFLGVDSAPAQGRKSDQGALVALRAQSISDVLTDSESDYLLDYVYARTVVKADDDMWAGHIHALHRAFGLTIIVMDHGGGGQWIAPELKKDRAKLPDDDGVWMDAQVRPIVPRSSSEFEGDLILVMFSRGDESIRELWPDELKVARGDDRLKDLANHMFRTAILKTMLAMPKPHKERTREEMATWTRERIWASEKLSVMRDQIQRVRVLTKPDGQWQLTANGSRIYTCVGKDDLHDAARNAYVGFRLWLKTQGEDGYRLDPRQRALGLSR